MKPVRKEKSILIQNNQFFRRSLFDYLHNFRKQPFKLFQGISEYIENNNCERNILNVLLVRNVFINNNPITEIIFSKKFYQFAIIITVPVHVFYCVNFMLL